MKNLNIQIRILEDCLPKARTAESRKVRLELLMELNAWQIKAEAFIGLPNFKKEATKVIAIGNDNHVNINSNNNNNNHGT